MSQRQSENMKRVWAERKARGFVISKEWRRKMIEGVRRAMKSPTYRGNFTKAKFADKTKHPRWIDGRSQTAEYHTVYSRNYKLRKRGAEGSFTPGEWYGLKRSFGHMCVGCLRFEGAVQLEADHVVSLANGGSNDISNIQPLCRNCNAQKHAFNTDYRLTWI